MSAVYCSPSDTSRQQNTVTQRIDSVFAYHQWVLTIYNRIESGNVGLNERMPLLIEIRDSLSIADDDAFYRHGLSLTIIDQLLLIAERLCDWYLLIFLLQTITPKLTARPASVLVHQVFDDQKSNQQLSLLVYAYQQLGCEDIAKNTVSSALLKAPEDIDTLALWQHVNGKDGGMSSALRCQDNELIITPLLHKHLYDFAWQYSETVIKLCNLLDFNENDDWFYWLDCMQHDKNRALFAIIHEEWGLIGCVSLQVFDGCGFFYYWLGDDFQGCGFGPRAVNLLLDYGRQQMGMRCCYAKIYRNNLASHKAIIKLGFQRLPFIAAAPHQEETFYYLGQPQPKHKIFTQIQHVFYQMDSSIRVVPDQGLLSAC